jgi:dTMP kinase
LRKGLFITFEGTEGSGKSTQLHLLAAVLKEYRIPHIVTREPGGSRLSTQLRRWILNKLDYNLMPRTELLLFLADRAQHVGEVVEPALKQGKVVLCDRYSDSTLAYQGGGRGFDMKLLRILNRAASELNPDLTLLFDLPVEIGLRRALGRGRGKDRMERENLKFHRAVRRVYLETARKEMNRFIVIDASQSREFTYQEMLEKLIERLPIKKKGKKRA